VQANRIIGRHCEEQRDWGLLTNGRLWRLYSAQARSRAFGRRFVVISPALPVHFRAKSCGRHDHMEKAGELVLVLKRVGMM
jgi:hypothetical protein